ncbi:hypothetical protein CFOL_v3_12693, partial [Cephalotus follicularis]
IKKQHVHKLTVTEIKMLRWMCGNTRKNRIRNNYIRNKIGVVSIEDKLREKRLMSFGHIERRPLNVPVRKYDKFQVDKYKKEGGKFKTTWVKIIKKDLLSNKLTMDMALGGAQ